MRHICRTYSRIIENSSFRIHSDNNIDNSIEILETWLKEQGDKYFLVNVTLDKKTHGHQDENSFTDWSPTRFEHIIKLRENILNYARRIWADYVFVSLCKCFDGPVRCLL